MHVADVRVAGFLRAEANRLLRAAIALRLNLGPDWIRAAEVLDLAARALLAAATTLDPPRG